MAEPQVLDSPIPLGGLPETGANDLSGPYMQHAQLLSDKALLESFRQEMRQGKPPVLRAPSLLDEQRAVRPQDQKSVVGAVASDIGSGFAEAPSAVVGGLTDAARNTAQALNNLGNWLNENVVDLRIDIPSTGSETVDTIVRPFLQPTKGLAELESVAKPKTVTGSMIREGARFVAGFVPALRAMRGMGGGGVPAVIGAGAVSDALTQDPNAPNISNLVQSVPALRGPLTEFLATDPDSPEAVNRLRHAVEGAGMGTLTEGVVRGVRALAQARKVSVDEVQAAQAVTQRADRDFLWLGSPDEPLTVRRTPSTMGKLATAMEATETGVPADVAAKGLTRAPGETSDVWINFARINQPDDVKQTIREMAETFKGEISEASRGVQTNEQTSRLANLIGMTPEDLLARRRGQPFNAEESLAARRLLNASAEKLTEAAQRAAVPGASPGELYNFRRMMAVHQAIQTEVLAARTETARALQSWAIPVGEGGANRARMIEGLLEQTGGGSVSQELARRIAVLAREGLPPGALANAVRNGWAATSMDMVRESYISGLLWSPKTHLVNVGSNLIVAFQQIYERAAGRVIGDVLGSAVDDRIVPGEALAMTYGLISSLKDAFRASGRAFRTGMPEAPGSKFEELPRAISAETIARERGMTAIESAEFANTALGRGIDFIGSAVRFPQRPLLAEDEFFKTIGYRMELHAQALRTATQEGLKGRELISRMTELVNSPSDTLRLSAVDASLYNTFQNKTGEFGRAMLNLRGSGGSLNPTFLVLPFVRTPTNILRYTFERTPLAPLVGQWRNDIAAGGARRDLALARMATGTGIIAMTLDYASSGVITGAGPKDPGKREALIRTGWQPYSVVIDGKYYSYNRLDPLGTLMGFAGTVAEKMKERDHAPEDFDEWEEVIAAGIGAVSMSVVDKTYFTGVMQLVQLLESAEQRSATMQRIAGQQVAAMVPFTTLLGTVESAIDPVTRERNTVWDAAQSRIIGLSDRLPPARDLWGRERSPQEVYGRAFDVLSPVAVRATTGSPIDEEMATLQMGKERIEKKGVFDGVRVDFRGWPEVYDQYVRLAGNELPSPANGLGAMDFLNSVVEGRSPFSTLYEMKSGGREGGKAKYISDTIASYRQLAQAEIKKDPRFAGFREYLEEEREKQRAKRFPLRPEVMPRPSGIRVPVQ